ncbi:MAG: NADH-quinone oxidoreductase subunit J [Paludibacteraceae bacterium]|nr:NADH-quinone oxidoreductase subunit J [Paludibacteraceae bacterium]MBR4840143.1 NADH-quinone oxidoreductase subunit J [Paludibacteraceae bacterium]
MDLFSANNIIFFLLATIILVFGFLSVTTTKILRAATYLFFVLFAIAGLYLFLSYEFLAAVQLSVYAGGIVVLFVFAILLVKNLGEETEKVSFQKKLVGGIAAFAGVVVTLITAFNYGFILNETADEAVESVNMQAVGNALMGVEKYQYLLPFEASSILLLACIIGSVVVAQKNKEEKR